MTSLSRRLLKQQREYDNSFIASQRNLTQKTGVTKGVYVGSLGQNAVLRTAAGVRLVNTITNAGLERGQVMQISGRNVANVRAPAAAPVRQPLGRGVV